MPIASDQAKKPIMAFFYGIYFAISLMILFGLFIFVDGIYRGLAIWTPPFSDNGFYMLRYPLHFNIPDFAEIIILLIILWLGWSIPMYFVAKKNYTKTQTDKKAKEEEIRILQNKIEELEKSIDQIKYTKDRL
ncbi:MAG: hypothetical protein HDS06_02400 [Bacteroides sp.]|nr:hypothetical protein [Bacteroides sp.]